MYQLPYQLPACHFFYQNYDTKLLFQNLNKGPITVSVNKCGGADMKKLDEMKKLVEAINKPNQAPVLVVSAFQGVTNQLIQAMDQLDNKDLSNNNIVIAFNPALETIYGQIHKFITLPENRDKAIAKVDNFFTICIEAIHNHAKVSKVISLALTTENSGVRDVIIGFGENTAAAILEVFYQENGIDAHHVENIKYIDQNNPNAKEAPAANKTLHENIQYGIQTELEKVKDKIGKEVLIIGGHIAEIPGRKTESGEILSGIVNLISRGYSDTTAVDTAIALKKLGIDVEDVNFWKDVDAALSIDPRKKSQTNTPKEINDLSLSEALEVASAGSGLLNTLAIILAVQFNTSLTLKNIEKPDSEGTHYNNYPKLINRPFKVVENNNNVDSITFQIPEVREDFGALYKLAKEFDEADISINDILTGNDTLTFTIPLPKDKADINKIREKIAKIKAKNGALSQEIYHEQDKYANISVIGDELRNQSGILGLLATTLDAYDIPMNGMSHNEEQRKIPIYVPKELGEKGLQAIHANFIDNDPEVKVKVKNYINNEWIKDIQNINAQLEKDDKITSVLINAPEMVTEKGFVSAISKLCQDHDLNIRDILTEGTSISLKFHSPENKPERRELRKKIRHIMNILKSGFDLNGEKISASVSCSESTNSNIQLRGDFKNKKGILAIIGNTLGAEGINIDGITYNQKRNNISFYVPSHQEDQAITALNNFLNQIELAGKVQTIRDSCKNDPDFISKGIDSLEPPAIKKVKDYMNSRI